MTIAQTPPLWVQLRSRFAGPRALSKSRGFLLDSLIPVSVRGERLLIYIYFQKAHRGSIPFALWLAKKRKIWNFVQSLKQLISHPIIRRPLQSCYCASGEMQPDDPVTSSKTLTVPKACWPVCHFLWQLEHPLCMPSAIYCISMRRPL